eukprot:143144_1
MSYFEFITNSVCVWYSAQLITIFWICTILIVTNHPYFIGPFEEIFLNPAKNNGISVRPYFQVNEYSADILEPSTVSDIQNIIVNNNGKTIRPIGSAHIIAGAGLKVEVTEDYLYKYGYVLLGFGSAMEQRLAGMLGTGVYGAFGSMNRYLLSVWIVDGNGNDLYITKGQNDTLLSAIKVNVGLLGVVYQVEYAIQKTFNVEASVEHYLQPNFHSLSRKDFNYLMKIDRNKNTDLNEFIGVKIFMYPWEYLVETFVNISDNKKATVFDYEIDQVTRAIIINILYPFTCLIPDFVNWDHDIETNVDVSASENNVYAAKSALRTIQTFWTSGMYAIPYEHCQDMMKDLQYLMDEYRPTVATIIPLLQSEDYGYLSYGYDGDVCMVEFYPNLCDSNRLRARKAFEKRILNKYNGVIHLAKRYLFTPENGANLNLFYSEIDTWKGIREIMDPNNIFVNDYIGKYFDINGYANKQIKTQIIYELNKHANGWFYAG